MSHILNTFSTQDLFHYDEFLGLWSYGLSWVSVTLVAVVFL
jgi:hypothetical protein